MATKKAKPGKSAAAPHTPKEELERRRQYLKAIQEQRTREKENLSRMLGKRSSSLKATGGGFKKDTFSPGHSGNK